MGLYKIRYRHNSDAGDMKLALDEYVSKEKADKFGVKLMGYPLTKGGSSFELVVDADNEENVKSFLGQLDGLGEVVIETTHGHGSW
jgi:hypothetical protein